MRRRARSWPGADRESRSVRAESNSNKEAGRRLDFAHMGSFIIVSSEGRVEARSKNASAMMMPPE
jgi:hypothetical protein